jgi:hypothetical protein
MSSDRCKDYRKNATRVGFPMFVEKIVNFTIDPPSYLADVLEGRDDCGCVAWRGMVNCGAYHEEIARASHGRRRHFRRAHCCDPVDYLS